MINIFLSTFFKIIDTLFRIGVRLLYHKKVALIFCVFWLATLVGSLNFYISIFSGLRVEQENENSHHGFYAINVGQGDSLLYVTKENQTVLIDTGKPGDSIVNKLKKILGKYRKRIDVLILTHPDSDHVGSLDNILSSYKVGLILYSPIYDVRFNFQKVMDEIKIRRASYPTLPVFAGENLIFSENEKVYFLSPAVFGMTTSASKKEISEDNYFSVVSMISGNNIFFAMADAPQKIEKVLVGTLATSSRDLLEPARSSPTLARSIFSNSSNLTKITAINFEKEKFLKIILKAGHHGSKTSSAPEFISSLLPTDIILSYGKNNRYGHPHKEVLETFLEVVPKAVVHQTTSGGVHILDE